MLDTEKIKTLFDEVLDEYRSVKQSVIHDYEYEREKEFQRLEREIEEYKQRLQDALGI